MLSDTTKLADAKESLNSNVSEPVPVPACDEDEYRLVYNFAGTPELIKAKYFFC